MAATVPVRQLVSRGRARGAAGLSAAEIFRARFSAATVRAR